MKVQFSKDARFGLFWLTTLIQEFLKDNSCPCRTVVASKDIVPHIELNEPYLQWNMIPELSKVGFIGIIHGAHIILDQHSPSMSVSLCK